MSNPYARPPAPTSVSADLTLTSVVDRARRRGVVFVTTTDAIGVLTVKWRPPRALDRDEAATIARAGAAALAEILDIEGIG